MNENVQVTFDLVFEAHDSMSDADLAEFIRETMPVPMALGMPDDGLYRCDDGENYRPIDIFNIVYGGTYNG